jgi:site-specific recombinase XerD
MEEVMETTITRTATVYTRHSADCADREQGSEWKKCNCPKWVAYYDGLTKVQRKVSAKTRSWQKAQDVAQVWLDTFDPVKSKVKQLEAEIEAQRGTTVSVEHAVFAYVQDQIARFGDNGTVSRTRTLLGDVDEHGTVKRTGKLFVWLDSLNPRPQLITELTTPMLMSWRAGWNYKSDMTMAQAWGEVKTFFKFCTTQGWLKMNPAAAIQRPRVKRGNRTATFSDEQYDAILAQAQGDQRLETFLELLRWSGMALIDAVTFDCKTVGDDGVLRYARQKTGTLATVTLPEKVLALLRATDGSQPFLRSGDALQSSIHEWRRDLQALFAKAGITAVKTDVGIRQAHPHMLRDTCAVWYLRHGMSLYGVSKILGHSSPLITARCYLPFVKELETAHIAENAAVLEAAKPKATGKVRAIRE